jgi:N-acyl-D-aspartate/D-glutamate deacylase
MCEVAWGEELAPAELAAVVERDDVKVTATALMTGLRSREENRTILEMAGRTEGRLLPQVINVPHANQFTLADPLQVARRLPAFSEGIGLPHDDLVHLYTDPVWRARVRDQLSDAGRSLLARSVLGESVAHATQVGSALSEIARQRGQEMLETLVDLSVEDDLRCRFRFTVLNDDEDELATFLRDPRTILGLSDAGAHADRICDFSFPTDLLGRWVRQKGVLEPEFAVWRLSGQVAGFLGLERRGLVREGFAADLVAYDPDRVAARAPERLGDLPAGGERLVAGSEGIEHVWVNGHHTVRDGRPVGGHGGVVLGAGPAT